MYKTLTSLLLLFILTPSVVQAGVSRDGKNRPRCRTNGGVTVCRMPKVRRPKKCGIMPCIPPGYYRPNPPKRVPMR